MHILDFLDRENNNQNQHFIVQYNKHLLVFAFIYLFDKKKTFCETFYFWPTLKNVYRNHK